MGPLKTSPYRLLQGFSAPTSRKRLVEDTFSCHLVKSGPKRGPKNSGTIFLKNVGPKIRKGPLAKVPKTFLVLPGKFPANFRKMANRFFFGLSIFYLSFYLFVFDNYLLFIFHFLNPNHNKRFSFVVQNL